VIRTADIDTAEQLPDQDEGQRRIGAEGGREVAVVGDLAQEQRDQHQRRIELLEQSHGGRFDTAETYAPMR